ncbi:hypothetical protein P7C71_g932, partial [Lecanoromycetidae sp. Uapishka_2]
MKTNIEVQVGLVVPRQLVKRTKNTLEAAGILNKTSKIEPFSDDGKKILMHEGQDPVQASGFHIPTTIKVHEGDAGFPTSTDLINRTGMQEHSADISFVGSIVPATTSSPVTARAGREVNDNLLFRTVKKWLDESPSGGYKQSETFGQDILYATEARSCSWTYMIYPPLLLLPPSTFLNSQILRNHRFLSDSLPSLYKTLCANFKITHIALNAPIPTSTIEPLTAPNILRSPTGLTPLYGDFGPALAPDHIPTIENFDSAFWCTSRQNGIFQTWAPRYTMFSRGNISEKARILNLETLTEKILGVRPEETAAVDLYAGIGYFAFSYAKAGVGKVLCWDINSWSVEGLRRGACGNKWTVKVVQTDAPSDNEVNGDERLYVFQESNEHAVARIEAMRDKIPPVKHVNCGLLPSSKNSWKVAVQVLDSSGGWIHAHENIAKKDIESRKEEIVETFIQYVRELYGEEPTEQRSVKCKHVELVKSYAPGVMHCVLDIEIGPIHRS